MLCATINVVAQRVATQCEQPRFSFVTPKIESHDWFFRFDSTTGRLEKIDWNKNPNNIHTSEIVKAQVGSDISYKGRFTLSWFYFGGANSDNPTFTILDTETGRIIHGRLQDSNVYVIE